MGSGKYLKYAQEKYGIENFKKEILFVFDNAKDMYNKESEIVNEDFLSTENTYNLKRGGFGGFDYIRENKLNGPGFKINGKENSKLGYLKIKEIKKLNPNWQTEKNRKASSSLKGRKGSFTGKLHSEESKIKMKGKGVRKGENNSQFGTCWVHHFELGNKKIKCEELDKYLSLSYTKGRKIK
jgi:hypothetical protein